MVGREIELTPESLGLDLVRLPSIKLNPRITLDWVQLSLISERSIHYAGHNSVLNTETVDFASILRILSLATRRDL